jgi:hypothetical protein
MKKRFETIVLAALCVGGLMLVDYVLVLKGI